MIGHGIRANAQVLGYVLECEQHSVVYDTTMSEDSNKLSKTAAAAALAKAKSEKLSELRDDSLRDALEVVSGTMAFRELDPESMAMPEDWEEKYGRVEARRRLAVARAGWMPAKEAPAAVKLSFDLVRSMMKDHGERAAPTLNVAIKVTETSKKKPEDLYEVIDVDDD